jgi:hypothetical protein|tara:strand:+ start:477 stop:866 length:390 start_codon:yes stop_codon:yes gene_type:complete
MENYLYFGEGGGANATTECALYKASSFIGVEPASATTTRIFFESPINDNHATAVVGDYVEVTHADTHATASSYHRCKIIAQAMAEAVNAGPHADGKLISIIDADNGVYFGGIADIIGDASFGITVNLDT